MPAPLLYSMFKAKTEYPLHTAIRAKREDVVFLYLMEFDAQVRYFKFISNLCRIPLKCAYR
jgi:hypothetical protein